MEHYFDQDLDDKYNITLLLNGRPMKPEDMRDQEVKKAFDESYMSPCDIKGVEPGYGPWKMLASSGHPSKRKAAWYELYVKDKDRLLLHGDLYFNGKRWEWLDEDILHLASTPSSYREITDPGDRQRLPPPRTDRFVIDDAESAGPVLPREARRRKLEA